MAFAVGHVTIAVEYLIFSTVFGDRNSSARKTQSAGSGKQNFLAARSALGGDRD